MTEEKRRVGIVGYWYATNYGSVATYYALDLALAKMGYDPVLVDTPDRGRDPEGENVFSRIFLEKRCKTTPVVGWDEIHLLNDHCDSFVVGSDQVWTKNAIHIARYMFFLNFAHPDKKKVAYAPSFGTDKFEIDTDMETKVRNYLRLFDGISVREESGREILSKKFDIDAERVLDPVFLIDPDDYLKIATESKRKTDGEYILAYILDPTPDKERAVSNLQAALGLPVKMILDGRAGTFDKNHSKLTLHGENVVPDVSEEDWIKLFSETRYVITDSHHGLAMAVIFHKPVIAYANHARGYTRFTSLMDLLSIRNRLINSSDEVCGLVDSRIDYEEVQTILDREKKRSIGWLKSVMGFDTPKNNVAFGLDLKAGCTGCSACQCICPKNAITMRSNQDGFFVPRVDLTKCSNCGLCIKHCVALEQKYDNAPDPACFAVWADDETRDVSSSGGMFTLAAETIINSGGCVFGAEFTDDFSVRHVMVDKLSDLYKLRGSKYIQSDMGNSYIQAKEQLERGKKVLFTGMPCQIAGLYSYLGKKYENLYTIDILCHGISPYKVFSKYHKDVLGNKGIEELYFKSKRPWGWMAGVNATFCDGSRYSKIITEDPYFIAYIKGLSRNLSCENCPFCRLPRQGDMTIGDFWKIDEYDKSMNDNKGTSVVLINNGAGDDLFERSSSRMVLKEKVPISYAIAGNGIIKYPYKLHPRRNTFFSQLESSSFQDLVFKLTAPDMPADLSVEQQELFHMAKFAFSKANGRQIVLWGDSPELRSVLSRYFHVGVPFVVTMDHRHVREGWIQHIDSVKNKRDAYFIIAYGKSYDQETHNRFLSSYRIGEDCIYRMMGARVINDLDLSKGAYSDEYGNRIVGNGIIKQVVLRGFNNKVEIGERVGGLEKLKLDLTANSRIYIKDRCLFTQDSTSINVQGYNGRAKVYIGPRCRFMSTLMRLFVSPYESSITLGENITFGDNLRMHANSGKKIILGKESMVSDNVVLWSGDGHSVFDVGTGNNINSIYPEQSPANNVIVIGEHVWVGHGALLLHGTDVGDGSIIGARSVVKKRYPSNCSVAGNPSKIIRKDVAWCHDMCATDINSCGDYANPTNESASPIHGLNVLVIGGSQNNGVSLVEALLANGNVVTLANRGRTPDRFGDSVSRIRVDVSNKESVETQLKGRKYDVVFNNLAYSSNQVRNILSTVQCARYIHLSSVAVYNEFHLNMKETEFDPSVSEFTWSKADGDYRRGKQNAECAVFQEFGHVSSVVIRIPHVVWDARLDFYCESIINQNPMNIDDPEKHVAFIRASELGRFLVWIAAQDFTGVLNFSSSGSVSIHDILNHIEMKTGKEALIDASSENVSPYIYPSYSMDVDKVRELGFRVSSLEEWFWGILDMHIDRATGK